MICPHCKKPIERSVSALVKKKAIRLHRQGYSRRDILTLLDGAISLSTVSRIVRSEIVRAECAKIFARRR